MRESSQTARLAFLGRHRVRLVGGRHGRRLARLGQSARRLRSTRGDTAWMLVSSALVLMMTAPGLALFYGGLVRSKNVLNLLAQSFVLIALISVQWVLLGYTLAFGPDIGGIVGGLAHLGLAGVGVEPAPLAQTIPHHPLHGVPDDVRHHHAGADHGRVRRAHEFSAFLVFSLLWATLVYDPLAHMVWGGGLIGASWGALDFAGGTVVHISSGMSALVVAHHDRQAARLRLRPHAAAQPAVHA